MSAEKSKGPPRSPRTPRETMASDKPPPAPGTPPIDPELVGLLAELRDQDNRQLLSRLAHWKKPPAPSVAEHLSPGSPFLSKLERHLLSVYRDELGTLIEEHCLALFLSEPAFGGSMAPDRDPDGRPILPRDIKDRRSERDSLAPLVEGDPPSESALSVLNDLLSGSPRRRSELLVSSLAGLQVRPSDALDIYAALGFKALDDLAETERRLLATFHLPARYRRKVVAAEHLGMVAWELGKREKSVEWHRWAATSDPLNGTPITPWALSASSWCINSIQLGDIDQVREAFALIAERFPTKDPNIHDHCHRLRAARLAGTWTPQGTRHLPTLAKTDNENTREIKAVFS